jgi:hypothetical protein
MTTPRWNARYRFNLFVYRSTNPSALAQGLKLLALFVQKKIDRENEFASEIHNSMPKEIPSRLLMHYSLRKVKLRLITGDAFYKIAARLKNRPRYLSKRSKI